MPKQKKNVNVVTIGAPIKVPGRAKCECQASVHGLVNNCLTCGRIVCDQEGAGPCFFCGSKVQKKGEAEGMQTDSELMFPDLDQSEQLAKLQAVKHKDKLLDYSRRDIHQTSIYDDQLDYFQIADNVWESEKTRYEAVDNLIKRNLQIEEDKKGINLQFDLATGQFGIAESKDKFDSDKFRDEAINFAKNKKLEEYKIQQQEAKTQAQKQQNSVIVDDVREIIQVDDRIMETQLAKEVFDELSKDLKNKKAPQVQKAAPPMASCKVQNDDFMAIFQEVMADNTQQTNDFDIEFFPFSETDTGMCLSMLQPWASLLVEGFKRIEGRHWNTSYRGPLWIHAGATAPSPEQISALEHQYEELYRGIKNRPPFPARYPTGALIGVVDLVGVLPQSKYEELVAFEDREEKDSDPDGFKFVVRNPRKMFYPISMRGNKDIYKLEDDIRERALALLHKVPVKWCAYKVDPNIFADE